MTREISHLQFISLYNEGMSDPKIAEALGFDRWQIRKYRKKMELPPNSPPRKRLTDEEKEKIKSLHAQDLTIKEISKRINRSYAVALRHCINMGLDTSMRRGQRLKVRGGETTEQRRNRRMESLLGYLKEHGPTLQADLAEKLHLPRNIFPRIAREFFDDIEMIRFKRGPGKRIRRVQEIYGELLMQSLVSLRGDPRIVNFIAERIPLEIKTRTDAATMVRHLKRQIGYERAREVVEKLGYKYVRPSHRAPKLTMKEAAEKRKKFSDDEFFTLYDQGLNDREIAERLNVCAETIGNRRRSMGLPAVGRRRKSIHCPKCGHKFFRR